jgi:hypothetical protein
MKDQYFGDVNDYKKYGLLRSIIKATDLHIFIAWMLTSGDGSSDGKFISYLEQPEKWSKFDPVLFDKIRSLINPQLKREVKLIEKSGLLPKTKYFSKYVPDSAEIRNDWFKSLIEQAEESDLIFLDPDNGFEVKSKPYGRKDSSKFIFWHEVEAIWTSDKSLLIYQHFTRENRIDFTKRIMDSLKNLTPGSIVDAFSTSHVVFFLALRLEHQNFHEGIVNSVKQSWGDQIQDWTSTIDQQIARDRTPRCNFA